MPLKRGWNRTSAADFNSPVAVDPPGLHLPGKQVRRDTILNLTVRARANSGLWRDNGGRA